MREAIQDMKEFQQIRIPLERIGTLIGKNGATKKKIEEYTDVKLEIDSNTGNVIIYPSQKMKDPTKVFIAAQIVEAIGRGFSEKKALFLLNPSYQLEIIELTGSNKEMKRIKGRIIGEKGRIRQAIENATDCLLAVYGKTISIIGLPDDLAIARQAIEMLINGADHGSVLRFLENTKFQRRIRGERLWITSEWDPVEEE